MGWFNGHINQKCPECGCYLQEKCWSGGGIIDALVMSLITAIVFSQAKCPLCGAKYPKQRTGGPPVARVSAPRRVLCAASDWIDLDTCLYEDSGVEPITCDTVEKLVATIKGQLASDGGTPVEERHFDAVLIAFDAHGMPVDEATRLLRQHGYQGPVVVISDHPMTKEEQDQVGCDDYVSTTPTFEPQFMWEIIAHSIADRQDTHT